ncbi:MAG: hypothetical protein IH600_03950 [Bacteroidetes bacterium]|nr:hypothetical protein [Bacteroidota bacterium]
MYTSTTASRRSWGGVFCVLFFATTLTITAQSWSVSSGGSNLTDVPSEKELMVVKQIIHSEMLGVDWKPLRRYENSYDHHAHMWSQQVSAWADGDWELVGRQLYSWDVWGELYSMTTQAWNGSMWQNVERIHCSFDIDSGDRTQTRFEWKGGDWALSDRKVYRYNDEGSVASMREYRWCEDGWRACVLTVMFYDNDGHYSGYERTELVDNFLCARSTAEVAPCGKIGEEIHYTRERGGEWVRDRRDRWTRNDCGLLTDLYVDEWQDGEWRPWKWDSYISAPFTLSAPAATPVSVVTMDAFPNPASGDVQVQIHCTSPVNAAVECVDILGRRLAILPARQLEVGTTTLPMQLQSLPRGLVLLRLIANGRVMNLRQLILR